MIILELSDSRHIIPKNSLKHIALKAIQLNCNVIVPNHITDLINCFKFGKQCPLNKIFMLIIKIPQHMKALLRFVSIVKHTVINTRFFCSQCKQGSREYYINDELHDTLCDLYPVDIKHNVYTPPHKRGSILKCDLEYIDIIRRKRVLFSDGHPN